MILNRVAKFTMTFLKSEFLFLSPDIFSKLQKFLFANRRKHFAFNLSNTYEEIQKFAQRKNLVTEKNDCWLLKLFLKELSLFIETSQYYQMRQRMTKSLQQFLMLYQMQVGLRCMMLERLTKTVLYRYNMSFLPWNYNTNIITCKKIPF